MRESKPIVVVSAMGGVTDALLQAGEAAVTGQPRQREDKLWEIRSHMTDTWGASYGVVRDSIGGH